jgi:hypothetical protein
MISIKENEETYVLDHSYAYIQKCMTYYEREKERLRLKAKRQYVPHPREKTEPKPKPLPTRPVGRPRKLREQISPVCEEI